MEDRIRQLESISRILEPDGDERSKLFNKVANYAESFFANLPDRPSYIAPEDQGIGILESPFSETPLGIDDILDLVEEHVDRSGVHLGSEGHLAFIPSSGLYASALSEYLAAITNRYSAVFFASPGAVQIDRMVLRWLADEIGYPDTAAGDITSGGSVANLEAIISAREAHNLKAKDYHRAVVYLTTHTHYALAKGLRIAGLADCVLRYVELDERFRMRPDMLEALIEQDKAQGLHPWLIVASAGTTDTGAVDPLHAIADISEKHGLWLHVDGAYGGMFILCDSGREKLQGINRADSISIDQHKGLALALGIGTVLFKEGKYLFNALHHDPKQHEANYLQDNATLASSSEMGASDWSIELSRPHRGLRLWLPLKVLGIAPFRARLEEKLLLAQYCYEKLQGLEGFEVGPPPDLSIVPFRYIPKHGDIDSFNQELLSTTQKDGRIFLSSTMINGNFTIRMAILSLRTHLSTIDFALELLQETASKLESRFADSE